MAASKPQGSASLNPAFSTQDLRIELRALVQSLQPLLFLLILCPNCFLVLRLDLTTSLQPLASSPQPQPLVAAAPAPGAPDSVMDTPEGVPTAQCWECSSSGGGGSSPIISRSGGQAQSSLCRHQVPSSPAQELGGSLWLSCRRPSLSGDKL